MMAVIATCHFQVKLAETIAAMDRDLVLYIKVADPHEPRLIYEVFFFCFIYLKWIVLINCCVLYDLEIRKWQRGVNVEHSAKFQAG